ALEKLGIDWGEPTREPTGEGQQPQDGNCFLRCTFALHFLNRDCILGFLRFYLKCFHLSRINTELLCIQTQDILFFTVVQKFKIGPVYL
ncbi:hypothetical protein ACJX0J_017200, partial [Zea mays]